MLGHTNYDHFRILPHKMEKSGASQNGFMIFGNR